MCLLIPDKSGDLFPDWFRESILPFTVAWKMQNFSMQEMGGEGGSRDIILLFSF
jgi:hypothetical protein